MYNRYIPQPDGSYHKNRVPDRAAPQPPQNVCPPEPRKPEPVPQSRDCPPACPPEPCQRPEPPKKPNQPQPECGCRNSAGDFLRNLLPRDLDTGDLLIILLLLLMAGDGGNGTALLTLALYLLL